MDVKARDLKPGDRFAFAGVPDKAFQALQIIVPNTEAQHGYLEYRAVPEANAKGLPVLIEYERFQQQMV